MLAVTALAAMAVPHGPKAKPFFNANKSNASTRGAAGSGAVQLYMMQPPAYLTGAHEAVGFEIQLQDEDALTPEFVDISFVRYAQNGIDPDETPAGEIRKATFRVFGFGPAGRQSFDFLLTLGGTQPLPDHFGIGLSMPANSAWPATDGLSIHGQLNLPNDPSRPRVPAPHQTHTWAFERPSGVAQARPLENRSLDTLDVTGSFAGSVIQAYVRTTAYGGGPEDLDGPESLYPSAARGDSFGIRAHGNDAAFPVFLLFISPGVLKSPVCCIGVPNSSWYLEFAGPFPLLLAAVSLDLKGQANVGPYPIASFPAGFRSFWLQGAVMSASWRFQLTDAVQINGI